MLKIITATLLTFFFCFAISRCARGDEIEDLIPKIIKVESNGNCLAMGGVGEIGLMQISPIVLLEFNNFVESLDGERGMYWFDIGQANLLHTSNPVHYGWAPTDRRGWYLRVPVFEGSMELNLFHCPIKEEDLTDPRVNTLIGTWYLNRLKDCYIPKDKYSVELLLACYNYGIGNMKKVNWDWKRAPKSTLRYIEKVLK